MLWLGALSIAALLDIGVAQVDLGAVAAESPACVTLCTVSKLSEAQCALTDVRDCLCTNNTLLSSLAVCVQSSCNLTEQTIGSDILQNDLCEGVPEPSRCGDIIKATVAVTVVTYFIFALRCISRYMVAQRFWWDDFALILVVICTIPMTIIPIHNASKGFGKHFWDVPPANLKDLRLLYYISQILYAFVQPITKISILLLYLRLFPNRHIRTAIIISLVWMACHFIAFEMEVILQCVPIISLWDLNVEGKCTSFTASIYAGAGLSIFEDFVIIILPVFALKDLNLTLRKKFALGLMFALGSFACITSMVRLKYIVSFSHSVDVTWDDVDLIIWSIIEVYAAIICACLVSVRPLIAKLFPRMFPTTRATEIRSKTIGNTPPPWPMNAGSVISGKFRSNQGTELFSEDGSWVEYGKMGTMALVVDRDTSIELSERNLPFGNAHLEPEFQHRL